MHRITPIARILLGLTFLVFSLNYFIPFLPEPKGVPAAAMAFAGAFASTGLLTFIKVVEVAAALALLSNRLVPLALTVLAPIIVGIAGFHFSLAPSGAPLAIGLLALELGLAWSYRHAFAPLFHTPHSNADARRLEPSSSP
jgi:putative oxidoreductase